MAIDIDSVHKDRPRKKRPKALRPKAATKLRKAAAQQDCKMQLPGICNFNPETVVAAHIRAPGMAGIGQKPHDILTVHACSSCHDEMDRRTRIMDSESVKALTLEAFCRTLMWYIENDLIEVKQ